MKAFSLTTGSRGEPHSSAQVPHSLPHAEGVRDALATVLFCKLFEWLTRAVNESMSHLAAGGRAAGREECMVGVVDMFGFESFDSNSLEQVVRHSVKQHLGRYLHSQLACHSTFALRIQLAQQTCLPLHCWPVPLNVPNSHGDTTSDAN